MDSVERNAGTCQQFKRPTQAVRLRFASWNVGTMAGKSTELAVVFKRRHINVACLQETKWNGSKVREIGEGYKFYFCGSDGKINGVGVALDSTLKKCVTDVKKVNDRIIVVKLTFKNQEMAVISAYAPQTGCNDGMKQKFWNDLNSVIAAIHSHEEVYIGGDFNGQVGQRNVGYERVHGGRGYKNCHGDGDKLLRSAAANDLAVVNTWFEKKDENLVTYKSGTNASQINYLLINRQNLKCVLDCKVIPGESVVAQHRLLLAVVKITIHDSEIKQ